MCMFKRPKMPAPPEIAQPVLPQAAKLPDDGAGVAVRRKVQDRLKGFKTILTSGRGVRDFAPTANKTLLGQ